MNHSNKESLRILQNPVAFRITRQTALKPEILSMLKKYYKEGIYLFLRFMSIIYVLFSFLEHYVFHTINFFSSCALFLSRLSVFHPSLLLLFYPLLLSFPPFPPSFPNPYSLLPHPFLSPCSFNLYLFICFLMIFYCFSQ